MNDTSATLTTHVTVSLTETATGDVYLLTVSVILPVGQDAMQELMDAIAAGYTDSSDGWTVMDMAVYSSLPGKSAATSEQAPWALTVQSYILQTATHPSATHRSWPVWI